MAALTLSFALKCSADLLLSLVLSHLLSLNSQGNLGAPSFLADFQHEDNLLMHRATTGQLTAISASKEVGDAQSHNGPRFLPVRHHVFG